MKRIKIEGEIEQDLAELSERLGIDESSTARLVLGAGLRLALQTGRIVFAQPSSAPPPPVPPSEPALCAMCGVAPVKEHGACAACLGDEDDGKQKSGGQTFSPRIGMSGEKSGEPGNSASK